MYKVSFNHLLSQGHSITDMHSSDEQKLAISSINIYVHIFDWFDLINRFKVLQHKARHKERMK